MTCPTCRRFVPDGLLACLDCTQDRSRAALRDYQRAPLRRLVDEGGELIVRHVGAHRHIQMYGCEFTFCNVHIPTGARRSRVVVFSAEMKGLCPNCQHEFAHAVQVAFE